MTEQASQMNQMETEVRIRHWRHALLRTTIIAVCLLTSSGIAWLILQTHLRQMGPDVFIHHPGPTILLCLLVATAILVTTGSRYRTVISVSLCFCMSLFQEFLPGWRFGVEPSRLLLLGIGPALLGTAFVLRASEIHIGAKVVFWLLGTWIQAIHMFNAYWTGSQSIPFFRPGEAVRQGECARRVRIRF